MEQAYFEQMYLADKLRNLTIPMHQDPSGSYIIIHHRFPKLKIVERNYYVAIDILLSHIKNELSNKPIENIDSFFNEWYSR